MSLYLAGAAIVGAMALIVFALWPKRSADSDAIKRRMTGKSTASAVADCRAPAIMSRSTSSTAPTSTPQSRNCAASTKSSSSSSRISEETRRDQAGLRGQSTSSGLTNL